MDRPLSVLKNPNFWFDDIADDLSSLEELCESYLGAIDNQECDSNLSDMKAYIFEATMITIFGKDVFNYINSKQT